MSNVAQIKRQDQAAEEQDPLRAALAAAIEAEAGARGVLDRAEQALQRGRDVVASAEGELVRAKKLVAAAQDRDGRAAAAKIRSKAAGASPDASATRHARARVVECDDAVEVSAAAIERLTQDAEEAATAALWATNQVIVARNDLLAQLSERILESARAARRDLRVCEALAVEILDRDAPDAPSFDDEVVAMKARAARASPLEDLREQAMSLFRTAARNVSEDDAAAVAEAKAGLQACIAALGESFDAAAAAAAAAVGAAMPTNTIYAPAISALQADLASLERRAASTRLLLDHLCTYAAGEPVAAKLLGVSHTIIQRNMATKLPDREAGKEKTANSSRGAGNKVATGSAATKARRASVAGKGKGKGTSVGGSLLEPPTEDVATLAELGVSKRQAEAVSGGGKGRKPKPLVKLADLGITEAQSKDDQASAQKIVAVISEASAEVQSAMRANDANKLSAAISARATAERVAGKLLVALAGKRPLPPGISKAQSKKYRRVAGLSAGEWGAALRRSQHRALRRIGAPAAALDSIGAKPERAKDRPSHAAPPHPRMKLTPWTTDSTGALTRTLTAEVDGGGAEAT